MPRTPRTSSHPPPRSTCTAHSTASRPHPVHDAAAMTTAQLHVQPGPPVAHGKAALSRQRSSVPAAAPSSPAAARPAQASEISSHRLFVGGCPTDLSAAQLRDELQRRFRSFGSVTGVDIIGGEKEGQPTRCPPPPLPAPGLVRHPTAQLLMLPCCCCLLCSRCERLRLRGPRHRSPRRAAGRLPWHPMEGTALPSGDGQGELPPAPPTAVEGGTSAAAAASSFFSSCPHFSLSLRGLVHR